VKRLPKPENDAGDTYAACISRVRDRELKSKLENLRDDIEESAANYDVKAQSNQLHEIAGTGDYGGVSGSEIQKVYKDRMAKSGTPGRPIYDQLMIVPQRRCPLCSHRDVSTLDHYLPESEFSLLVVTPFNLVPSCKDCNFNKKTFVPSSSENHTFHPYYDDFDDAVWLVAHIVQSDPLGVQFQPVKPLAWDDSKFNRARHHFEKMKLHALYSDNAVSELIEVRAILCELFSLGGCETLTEEMAAREASIRRARPNSWRAALFAAAAADVWFCEGGFKNIEDILRL